MSEILEVHHLLLMGAAYVAGFWMRGWRIRRRRLSRRVDA